MAKKKLKHNSESLSEIIIKGIQEKKGKDIVSINLQKIHGAISDFFIICHGTSSTQIEAIANSVDMFVKKTTGQNPSHTEGYQNAEWILLDYFDVVVHIFNEEARRFYQLEKLWADAEIKLIASEN